ncbi:predicted protein [Nematostella vectensis]|uniref:Uncharacterized protein n=1 Tax=Nematostella vectensis TaxID=45351 RepID=A7SQT1_NEMVE|nr:predicted protein [Nematostella vectensis]|eukprot:XP_001626042.1 predicted protein [Nematostella vectensis]
MSGLKETKTKGSEDEMEVDIVDSETEQEENMAVTLPSVDGCSAVDSSEMNQTDVRSRSDLKTVQVRTSNNGQATSVLGTEVNEGRDPQISNGPAIDSELDQSDRKENDNLLKTDKISGSYVVSDCLSTGLDPVDSNTPLEGNVGTKQRIEECDMMPDCGSDDNDEDEPYNRFFFESDYLALKDNAQ